MSMIVISVSGHTTSVNSTTGLSDQTRGLLRDVQYFAWSCSWKYFGIAASGREDRRNICPFCHQCLVFGRKRFGLYYSVQKKDPANYHQHVHNRIVCSWHLAGFCCNATDACLAYYGLLAFWRPSLSNSRIYHPSPCLPIASNHYFNSNEQKFKRCSTVALQTHFYKMENVAHDHGCNRYNCYHHGSPCNITFISICLSPWQSHLCYDFPFNTTQSAFYHSFQRPLCCVSGRCHFRMLCPSVVHHPNSPPRVRSITRRARF